MSSCPAEDLEFEYNGRVAGPEDAHTLGNK